jgi:subtilisin-like proprotein convertase family protein
MVVTTVTPSETTVVTICLVTAVAVVVTETVLEEVFVKSVRSTVDDLCNVEVLVRVRVDTDVPYRKALHRELTSPGAMYVMVYQREAWLADVIAGAAWTFATPRKRKSESNRRINIKIAKTHDRNECADTNECVQ